MRAVDLGLVEELGLALCADIDLDVILPITSIIDVPHSYDHNSRNTQDHREPVLGEVPHAKRHYQDYESDPQLGIFVLHGKVRRRGIYE